MPGSFRGRVIGIRDVVTFQGKTVEDVRGEFAASVDDYLDFCLERGGQPEVATVRGQHQSAIGIKDVEFPRRRPFDARGE